MNHVGIKIEYEPERPSLNARQFCEFLKNIEWDIEESRDLAQAHIDDLVGKTEDGDGGEAKIPFVDTLSLWRDEYSLSPLIQEFNFKMLQKCSTDIIQMFLPQLVLSMRTNKDKDICSCLIFRCSKDDNLAIRFFWNVIVHIDGSHAMPKPLGDPLYRHHYQEELNADQFFGKILYKFTSQLAKTEKGSLMRKLLKKQGDLVEKLVKISGTIRQSRSGISKKRELLKKIITDTSNDLLLFDPLPLPIKTHVKVIGIVPEQCNVFNSNLNPLLLTFQAQDGTLVKCIFKSGDDLRQDSVITQIMGIMDQILKRKKLDMEVVSYEVVSTGLQHGFIEYIESEALDNVLQDEKGLSKILRKPDGMLDEVKMTRFVKSAACYTVMTYILCIGDRHLDNILMTDEGRMFHIDYGFVAREPKPFAPPMKLCPEIVSIMGGKHSGYYSMFVEYCRKCYVIFRENSDIILDAISLMVEDEITDITDTTLEKIRRRFNLALSDKQAVLVLTSVIEKSFENVLPQMMDGFHRNWKNVWQ